MDDDRGLTPTEEQTLQWLEERFATEVNTGEPVYETTTEPRNVTQEHFGHLLRQLRILRWLDRFRFESLVDIGSGFAFMPWLLRDRYKCETFYCDYVHRWNVPIDLWEQHKVDHAVTAKLPLLPFADGAFEAVLCTEVLEHLVRPVEALAELVRVARRYVVFTSLEALSSGRLRRWIDHHRVDLSVPHVERNFLVLGEFRAMMGDGFHSECFEYPADMPSDPWAPEEERRRAYARLRDRETLATALSAAARTREHVPGAMGILGVKIQPGATLDAEDPSDDHERARWLIERAARRERLAREALGSATVIRRDPTPGAPRSRRPSALPGLPPYAGVCRLGNEVRRVRAMLHERVRGSRALSEGSRAAAGADGGVHRTAVRERPGLAGHGAARDGAASPQRDEPVEVAPRALTPSEALARQKPAWSSQVGWQGRASDKVLGRVQGTGRYRIPLP
jgi:hypothetical protein